MPRQRPYTGAYTGEPGQTDWLTLAALATHEVQAEQQNACACVRGRFWRLRSLASAGGCLHVVVPLYRKASCRHGAFEFPKFLQG